VQLDKLLHKREADARTFEGAAPLAFDPMEALEQARQFLRRDADAGIADRENGEFRGGSGEWRVESGGI
jgi:hypothetical protein